MESIEEKSLGVVDWILFIMMLLVSLGIGIYSALKGRGNNSTQEYLLGGRQMSAVPVAISLLGGYISAISILGLATEMYYFGTQLALNLIGCIMGTLIVQHLLLPVLYPLKIVSLNEYILLRFESDNFRKWATLVSLASSFVYMGICLYAPSLTLSTVTNLPTWASITIMGVICTFYISIGGVKAVVYTDVVQTTLMFGGVLLVVIISCVDLGGVGNVFRLAEKGHRLEFFNMDPSPLVRHTFWSVHVQGLFSMVSYVGLNQSCYQRFASVSTITISKRLCSAFLLGLNCLWLTNYFSGIVAYATYKDCDPLTSGRIYKPDQILPYLVLDKLSHLTGMAGLFVAAVYGGVLSSLSSTGNAVACVVWQDILKDMKIFKNFSDQASTSVIKVISAMAGLIGIGLGMAAGQLGEIFQVSNSITSAISGSFTGIFLTGICAPWANRKGAYAGLATSLLFNLWIVIGAFAKGLGSPEKLPLSVEGCPENLHSPLEISNITSFDPLRNMSSIMSTDESSMSINSITGDNAFTFLNNTPSFVSTTTSHNGNAMDKSENEKNIYNLSYCYTGTLGTIINFIVATVVSFLTGPIHPKDVRSRLVSPRCNRLYKKIWKYFRPLDDVTSTKDDYIIDKESTIPMITKDKSIRIDNPE